MDKTLTFRLLNKDETDLLKTVARFDQNFPSFYRNASSTWTTTEDESLAFYTKCVMLFGIFDQTEIIGLAYFENVTNDGVVNVHLDAKRGVKAQDLVDPIAGIRDYIFTNGVRICMAWTLKRNRILRRVLEVVGFRPSFLEMKAGSSHGKVLKWEQLLIAPNSFIKC